MKLERCEGCFATFQASGIYHFYHWQSCFVSLITKEKFGKTGFYLTFQKLFVSFVDETNCKTDHKSCSSWVGGEESFYSRLPKTALNSGFLPSYLTEKTSSNLHLVLESFFKKELC